MLIGPVFTREAVTSPRRPKLYVYRTLYVTALFILMCTAWLVLAGAQLIRNTGDLARFGAILFQILAPIQLALVVFFSALLAASAVSQEKDRRTLVLLMLTRLTNCELVVGKLLASLLNVAVMVVAGLPVFMLVVLFGGVSFGQVGRVFGVTMATALAAGSLGSTLALWREKTFQTLAMTALSIVLWLAVCEGIFAQNAVWFGRSAQQWAVGLSPFRAVIAAARPDFGGGESLSNLNGAALFVVIALSVAAFLNVLAVVMVRIWNQGGVRPRLAEENAESIWGENLDQTQGSADVAAVAETARAGHVDSGLRGAKSHPPSRQVWDNPILWREMKTWAYGRKVLVIHAVYLVLFALAAAGLYASIASGAATMRGDELGTVMPVAAKSLAPFFLVSLVVINALAVTCITTERDGLSLDLLLVTDLSPREFLFGKLGGVFWITRLMVGLPLLMCGYLWWAGGLTTENLAYLACGLIVMDLYVAMLGLHCGMIYASSRSAIAVSMGSVFFLFLGVVTCILMMISFSGSFQVQLAPFLAFILGGSVGLYVSLGVRNPSPAIAAASLLLPFATFYAITSFLLNYTFAVFIVTVSTYGFTTAAMMMPALGEFDIAMGRGGAEDVD